MKKSELNELLKKTAHEATLKERRSSAVNLLSDAIKIFKAESKPDYRTDKSTGTTTDDDDTGKTVEKTTGDSVREAVDTNYQRGLTR
jgi:phage gpG-like protein